MLILGVDFETTGLDTTKDSATEAGAVLWDWEAKTPVLIYSKFVNASVPISQEITKLTGITQEMVTTYGEAESEIALNFQDLIEKADYICAHNAPFDKGVYTELCKRSNLKPTDKLWLDTSVDVPYSEKLTGSRKLVHLAAEHGFVNPFAHRAVTDVLTMLMILAKYDINEVIENAKAIKITVMANTNYEQRELAKNAGFRWDAPIKAWTKVIKQNSMGKEIEKCEKAGFTIKELKNVNKQ